MATKKTKPINWNQLASDLGVVPEWQKQRLDQPVAAPAPAPASEPRPINWDELASDLGVVSEWKWQRPEPTTIVSAPTTPAPQPAPSGPSLFGRRVSLPQLPRIVQAPAQRPAMTWGAQPLGQAPQPVAPAPSYPAISSPLATVRPPSRPMTADYLQRARAALSKRQAPYWEQTLAHKGYPAPAALTPAARTLERYRQLFGKTLPLSILYGPIVGGYQAMPAAQGQEVAPQQPGAERTAYMGIQGALSGASLGALPITEQARNTQEQVAQVGGQFAGAALPWEAAFRLVGAPAAIAAGPAGEALGNAAARLAARLGAREGTRQGTRALTQFLTREAARGAAAGAAATAPTLLTEPAKTPEEAARRVGGAVLSAAAVSAGLPLVGEAVSRFGARPIARMVGDRLRTFIPTGEAVAGSEVDLASAGYRFVKGRGNVPGLWVKQEPTTGLHYGVRVERRVTPGGNVETTYQTFQEAPRGAKAGPKPAEAGPVIDVTAKPAGEPAAPQAAAPAAPAQEPAATPQEPVRTTAAPAEPVATEAPASTSAEVPGPSPNVPATVQEERSGAKVDGMLQVKYPPTKQTQAALKTVPKPVWGSFQRSGITRVEIVAPNELPLSAVADVSPSQGILRINANAGSMTEDIGQTIAHEIGHVVYSRMTPEQRDNIKAAAVLYPDIVKRVAPGYASTGASEEVISELYAEAVLHPKSLPEDLRAALLAEPQGQAPAPAAATEAEITNVPRLPAPHKSWKQVAADYHGQVDPEADLAKLIEKDGDVPLVLKDANGGRHVVMASVWNSQLRHDPLVTGNIREVFLPANGPVEPRIDTHTLPYLPDLAEGLRRGIAAAIEDGNTSAAKLLPALPAPKGEVLKADLPPVALVRYEEGAEQKEAPELVAAAERQNQAIEGGGGFWVGRAFFGQSENREPIWVISSGTYEFAPAADWLEVPTRDKQQHIYILASPKARPTNAPEAEPTQAKEPWQITRAEFQLNENRQKYEVIVSALEANKKLVLGTQYRGTVLTKPEHVRLNKQGEVQVMFGAKWVFLTSPQLNDLAARAGMKIPDFGERVYHRDIVEKALADGKPVPDEVLKDYPDLTEPEEVASLAEPLGPLNEAARGSDVTAETERGTKVQLHYAIAEASDLVASHDTALRRNPDYPAELQPRDRGRIASEEQVSRIASKLNPVRLGESPMVADGAPVVGPDGVVESGNGRVIALQRVYDQEHANAGKYRQWLLDNAEKFGLDKAAIEGTQAPVLVRVRDTEVDRVKFTQEANEQAVASMSATEKAKNDAKKLTGVLMAQFVPNETGEIDTPANRAAFIQNFMEKVVSDAERGELMQDNAKINQAGVIRIRNAIFAKAYGDITIIEKLAESTDNNVRNLTNAMLVAAPRLAAIKEGIAGGRFYDLDLTGDIAAAVNTLSMLREAGQTVDEYFRQPAILKGTLTDLGKDLLDVFEANGRSTKKLSSILLAYADMVEAVGDPRYGSDLLGRTVAPTRAEVLTAALRKVEFGSEGQATLLEGETAGGPETGANPPALGEEQGQGRPEFGDQTQQVAHLVIRKGESGALRSALDAQGKIRVGLDSITIKADARVPADVAQAVKDAARGWEVVRNRDGSVILRRPAGPSQAVVREVEALYEREGVREGADPEKSKHLARRVLEDISSGGDSSGGTSAEGLRPRVRTRGRAASLAKNLGSGVRTLGV
ncbi:MAG: hypothetical protein M1602_01705, partial [Firmicutes bacterium]|nr:hypothetical protein [Bacillota bacterium]